MKTFFLAKPFETFVRNCTKLSCEQTCRVISFDEAKDGWKPIMYGMPSGFDDRLHPRTFEGRQRHYLSDSISVSSGSMDEITGPPTRRLVIGLKVSGGMNEDANLFTRSFSRRARWRAIIKFNHPSPRAGGGKIYNSPCSCMSSMRHGSALHSESKHTRQPHPIALMKLFIGRFSC
jgi:hypothetical protein